MTRLNLGCGKVVFPWAQEKAAAFPKELSVPASAYEPDWRNIDALALPGVDEVVDLFAYPWPWADNSVSEIWASHIVEHIPHAPRVFHEAMPLPECKYWMIERWCELANLDGFYAFFAEVYRVLIPGGTIGIECPYGKSDGAIYDPQHTRQITETTFHYLGNGGNNSPTYDYQLPLNFAATHAPWLTLNPPWGEMPPEQWQAALISYWNVASTIRVELQAVK